MFRWPALPSQWRTISVTPIQSTGASPRAKESASCWQMDHAFHADRRGCHVTLDAVPAWVCGQCGEAYFEEKEVDAVQKLIDAIEQEIQALAPIA
jgi:hypothetical protein